jgi:predicted nucleic acid-binding protein
MLVDTSVWIDFFNGYPSAQADRLTAAIADGERIVLTGVVLTEILSGLKNESAAERIGGLLTAFEMAPELVTGDYYEAARIYRLGRMRGLTIRSTIDCLIARLCLREGLALLTKDRDFAAIAGYLQLRLVLV